jgi:hypothetical protein
MKHYSEEGTSVGAGRGASVGTDGVGVSEGVDTGIVSGVGVSGDVHVPSLVGSEVVSEEGTGTISDPVLLLPV